MTKKELIDIFFKGSLIVMIIILIFVYYSNAQINRYRFKDNNTGHYVFDSCTGKLYEYYFVKDSKTGETTRMWGVFTPFEDCEIKFVKTKRMK